MARILNTVFACCLALAAAHGVKAQAGAPAPEKEPASNHAPAPAPRQEDSGKLARWFELQTATLMARYLSAENSSGARTMNRLQHNMAFKGRIKFDPRGNYSLNAGLFSGNRFVVSWNNSGVGDHARGATNLYLKQLYFSAKPAAGLELQYGGLYLLRGESTEITSYDNDGYVVGQRVTLRRPKQLFFDEVSVTYGYLGDLTSPNINRRWHRLRQSNYHQFLVSKNVGRRAAVSADYTFQAGVETTRQAVKFNARGLRVVDSLRFEIYQRADVKPAYGLAVAGEKTLFKRLSLNGGYADIDPHYGGLNADRFGTGKRLFLFGTFVIKPEFSVSTYLTQGTGNNFAVANHRRFEVLFSYNLSSGLRKAGLFR